MRRALTSLLAACLAAGALFPPRAARAQETPAEVRKAAHLALGTGDFSAAIPYLLQLISWFKDTKDPSLLAELEGWYFNLGLSHLLLGQFGDSRGVFEEYLKRFRRGGRAHEAAAYVADTHRYEQKLEDALKAYAHALKTYDYTPDLRTDLLIGMVRCHLAKERWAEAIPLLQEVYRIAPDFRRRNWAGTLLTTAYLNERRLDSVYWMMPLLLQRDSFASYSVALNVAALQVGDDLFADEKYRDALWIYRLVYPHDLLMLNTQTKLEQLQRRVEALKQDPGRIRVLLRTQEQVSEVEAEIKALEQIPNYDPELSYRIARAYLETRRYRESCELFYNLYLDGPKEKQEECLYLSFVSATKFQPLDRAFARGAEYMKVYPAGEFYDTVSLTVGQLYANLKDWPKVIETITAALEVSPKHQDIVECLFLLGYAYFQEERFAECVQALVRMNTEFPGNDREAEGTYWTGMGLLFDKKYEEAVKYFDRVVEDFPDCPYVEDASFRSATCDFGLSRFYESEGKLLKFVARYPGSKLLAEAYLMLGDCSGSVGELAEAVRRYQEALAREADLNIELYNHGAFRCGEILSELKDYDGLVSHFRRYVERNRADSNLPMAIYWIGHGYWQKGEQEAALATFRRAVEEYGRERRELGVDLILEHFVGQARSAAPAVAEAAWKGMRDLLRQAIEKNESALALRLERILIHDPSASDKEKQILRDALLRPQSLPNASPGVLEFIVEEALRDGRRELAMEAAQRTIADFTETDYALSARALLARDAAERKDYDEAVKHLDIIREVYASSDEAAEALLTLGGIYLEQRRFDEADAAYKDLLGTKNWKALWPAALYGRGRVAQEQRKFEQAAAYYERIYVLYRAARTWVAKAYVARAECLGRLFEVRKAIETLDEMLANPELANLPEAAEARELKEKLQRRT